MQELDAKIKLGEAVEKLKRLPEFKLLLKDYLETKALALTYSLGGIDLDKSNEHNVTKQLSAIASFKQYLAAIEIDYQDAKEDKLNLTTSE